MVLAGLLLASPSMAQAQGGAVLNGAVGVASADGEIKDEVESAGAKAVRDDRADVEAVRRDDGAVFGVDQLADDLPAEALVEVGGGAEIPGRVAHHPGYRGPSRMLEMALGPHRLRNHAGMVNARRLPVSTEAWS